MIEDEDRKKKEKMCGIVLQKVADSFERCLREENRITVGSRRVHIQKLE